jgi:ribosome-associated heat shock protein Hsp15
MPRNHADAGLTGERQRIDKWLWHARLVRTRTAAAALAGSGRVRINGQRIDAPSRSVRSGDVVTVALSQVVRLIRITGFAARRGSPGKARQLYVDLTQPTLSAAGDSADPIQAQIRRC